MAGEQMQHWDFDPETGDYLFPSEPDEPIPQCASCGEELLGEEIAVTLGGPLISGPCQRHDVRVAA